MKDISTQSLRDRVSKDLEYDTEAQDELNLRKPSFIRPRAMATDTPSEEASSLVDKTAISRPRASATDTPSEEASSLDTSITRARATATDTASKEAQSLTEDATDVAGDVAGDVAEDVAEDAGENVVSTALESAGGALEGLGSIEDATGILAPLGVFTQLAGAVSLVGGLVGGGVSFVKDLENTFKFNHAQDEVKNAQNAPVNVAGKFVLPTSNHANLQNLR